MKCFRIYLMFFLMSVALHVQAQTSHFVYIQTENKQPFYLKTSQDLYSSSESGYVIVTKLNPGFNKYVIGFPKNQWPTQTFMVDITNADRGLLLKKNESEKWLLVDIVTKETIESLESVKTQDTVQGKTDEFSRVLARVTDNPSIIENNVDESGITPNESSLIRKIYSFQDKSGVNLRYAVFQNNKIDTIVIYFSYKQNATKNMSGNVRCNKLANDNDFIKLRRKMIEQDEETEMLKLASGAFKSLCYTVSQIKALAMIMMTEQSRFELLKSSIGHVSDKENMVGLQTVLTNQTMIKEFIKLTE